MKTLADYIKGYPNVEVYILAKYRDKFNNKYYLCKQPGYNNYYFMKGEEVIDKSHIKEDRLERLSIDFLNNKDVLGEIEKQQSYKLFVRFIKEQTGDDYIYGRYYRF